MTAGPHDVGVTFPRKHVRARGDRAAAGAGALQHGSAPARAGGALLDLDRRAVRVAARVGDTPSRRRVFVCRPRERRQPRRRARSASSRRWRAARSGARSPTPTSRRRCAFYREARADGRTSRPASRWRCARCWPAPSSCSASSATRRARRRSTAYRISDVELASRLSFFLWSSVPDDELLDVATAGRLPPAGGARAAGAAHAGRPAGRRAGRRTSPASGCTCATSPPRARTRGSSPTSTTTCARPSGARPSSSSQSIVREDRNVLDLLRANYTFVNERLAKHYGIPNVYGSRFRRVALGREQRARRPAGPGQHPDRHLVRQPHLAGAARQVGAREHRRHAAAAAAAQRAAAARTPTAQGRVLSMRERMAQHRANPACASCHQLMDPAGLSLENFDAIGRWRVRTESGGGRGRLRRACPTARRSTA